LWRALVRILVLILVLRRIGRGNLSILGIGWRSGLAPVTRLAWRRRLLRLLRGLLGRRNQGRSQRQARAQSSRKHPLQTISIHIHFLIPFAVETPDPSFTGILHRRQCAQSVTVL
jgi:hypothetical protein